MKEISEELCRTGSKINKEKLFLLSPVYLLPNHMDNNHLQYLLNNLKSDLENKELISSKSHIFLNFSLSYNSSETQLGLYDESGTFRNSLEQWLSYIRLRYHFEHGIILFDIKYSKAIIQDSLWWKQFFSDIKRYKKNFLFFVDTKDVKEIQSLFEKETFTVTHELCNFTAEDYYDWFNSQAEQYSVFPDEICRTELKRLFVKYESSLNHHVLELWMKSLIWSYYSSETAESFSVQHLSEDLLIEIIDRCKNHEDSSAIGFI
jgi:hypothetical protein